MIESILLPTDGSECARAASAHAAAIAREYGATVHVMTVVEAIADDVTASHRESAANQRIEPVVADLEDAGVEPTTAIAEGIPVEEITATADERGVDLIAMGTHGRSGLRRQILGSVAERVLRTADVPVLAVPDPADDGRTPPYENVLVPTDGSEGAAAATPLGIDLARTFGATLYALSVVDTRPAVSDARASVLVEQFEELAEDAVSDLAAEAAEAGVDDVVTAVLEGSPHEALDTYVDDTGIDLVVMGTHGRSGLDRYLLGSVTEKLLRTTAAPVLAVRVPSE